MKLKIKYILTAMICALSLGLFAMSINTTFCAPEPVHYDWFTINNYDDYNYEIVVTEDLLVGAQTYTFYVYKNEYTITLYDGVCQYGTDTITLYDGDMLFQTLYGTYKYYTEPYVPPFSLYDNVNEFWVNWLGSDSIDLNIPIPFTHTTFTIYQCLFILTLVFLLYWVIWFIAYVVKSIFTMWR